MWEEDFCFVEEDFTHTSPPTTVYGRLLSEYPLISRPSARCRRIDVGLVSARMGNSRLEIIGDQDSRNATIDLEGMDMGPDP